MRRGVIIAGIITAGIAVSALSGCGTVPKKFKEEVGNLGGRVTTLESRVEGVETRQSNLESAAQERVQTSRTNITVKEKPLASRSGVKEIQACLKSAGLYNGKIDGVKGRATRKAIREFQRANNLKADGVVGPKTLEALSKYKP